MFSNGQSIAGSGDCGRVLRTILIMDKVEGIKNESMEIFTKN